ncbi:MAG: class I SAM-dependent methyltransferase [Clostridia bacterium]|nr:class I SAM-dependent methyltransferase [Clostridia bacterium]
MNTIWSKHVQGIHTLYSSRTLRFNDFFAPQYLPLFALDGDKPLKILEIGCGPGALAAALHRWYPQAEITALDRDSEFIRFARKNVPGVTFLEGDATALPFPDGTFDVTISNTVAEHIEPSAFYGEQRRVLRDGGVCLVLSGRRGLHAYPEVKQSDFEQAFWNKVAQHDDSLERYAVCKYPMSEMEMPHAMTQHGFSAVRTGYAIIDLTPDDPKYPAAMAHAMIDARRHNDLDAIASARRSFPDHVSEEEAAEMSRIVNERYDARIAQYHRGEKVWDTGVSITMIVRGVKGGNGGKSSC